MSDLSSKFQYTSDHFLECNGAAAGSEFNISVASSSSSIKYYTAHRTNVIQELPDTVVDPGDSASLDLSSDVQNSTSPFVLEFDVSVDIAGTINEDFKHFSFYLMGLDDSNQLRPEFQINFKLDEYPYEPKMRNLEADIEFNEDLSMGVSSDGSYQSKSFKVSQYGWFPSQPGQMVANNFEGEIYENDINSHRASFESWINSSEPTAEQQEWMNINSFYWNGQRDLYYELESNIENYWNAYVDLHADLAAAWASKRPSIRARNGREHYVNNGASENRAVPGPDAQWSKAIFGTWTARNSSSYTASGPSYGHPEAQTMVRPDQYQGGYEQKIRYRLYIDPLKEADETTVGHFTRDMAQFDGVQDDVQRRYGRISVFGSLPDNIDNVPADKYYGTVSMGTAKLLGPGQNSDGSTNHNYDRDANEPVLESQNWQTRLRSLLFKSFTNSGGAPRYSNPFRISNIKITDGTKPIYHSPAMLHKVDESISFDSVIANPLGVQNGEEIDVYGYTEEFHDYNDFPVVKTEVLGAIANLDFFVRASPSEIYPMQSFICEVNMINVPSGQTVNYSISGISQENLDIPLSGVVTSEGEGSAVSLAGLVAQATTPGSITVTFSRNATSQAVDITVLDIDIDFDVWLSPASSALEFTQAGDNSEKIEILVREGADIRLNFDMKDMPEGLEFSYNVLSVNYIDEDGTVIPPIDEDDTSRDLSDSLIVGELEYIDFGFILDSAETSDPRPFEWFAVEVSLSVSGKTETVLAKIDLDKNFEATDLGDRILYSTEDYSFAFYGDRVQSLDGVLVFNTSKYSPPDAFNFIDESHSAIYTLVYVSVYGTVWPISGSRETRNGWSWHTSKNLREAVWSTADTRYYVEAYDAAQTLRQYLLPETPWVSLVFEPYITTYSPKTIWSRYYGWPYDYNPYLDFAYINFREYGTQYPVGVQRFAWFVMYFVNNFSLNYNGKTYLGENLYFADDPTSTAPGLVYWGQKSDARSPWNATMADNSYRIIIYDEANPFKFANGANQQGRIYANVGTDKFSYYDIPKIEIIDNSTNQIITSEWLYNTEIFWSFVNQYTYPYTPGSW